MSVETVETQIIGERVAREVSEHAAAETILNQKDRSRSTSWWMIAVIVCTTGLSVQGILYGTVLNAFKQGQYALPLFGFCALFATLLAISCFTECRRLRRRLDAAIVLLQAEQRR
ncbi:MAG: hypothetical protein WBD81_03500 [Collimonas pratensis]|uniref:hypothetical protein n=1 Tax=Collimonas pratensis TaxID=279113 RepID=UPI003C78964E